MTEVKSRALDYLGRSFAMKGAYTEAAEIWDSRLAIAKTPVERAYLFHEIGRCYLGKMNFNFRNIENKLIGIFFVILIVFFFFFCISETNKPDLARFYGNQSLEEANKINDDIWAMNANILLGQCDSKFVALTYIHIFLNPFYCATSALLLFLLLFQLK